MRSVASRPAGPPGDTDALLCRIPSFRPIVIRLLQILGDDDTSLSKVSELLNSDPGLSAEVLTAANSAIYGIRSRIHTIARAIVMLGTERTKALATQAALDAMLRDIGSHPTIGNCWSHSRASAVIGQWLAPSFGIHPDRAYTAGLLHDVGRLGLLSLDTKTYAALLDNTGPTDQDVLEAERELMKLDHCEAGARLTLAWGFPDELRLPVSHHHDAKGTTKDPGTNLARVACSVSQALGYTAVPMVTTPAIPDLLQEVPNFDCEGLDNRLGVITDRLTREVGRPVVRPQAA
jgi:HD-like signal output (HDOD) protein